jgi:hypothetical protein
MATAPYTHPDLYRVIQLGGQPSPGKVTLSGHERDHDWDVQKAKGATGATTVNRGLANGGFTASFYLADEEDVAAWDVFHRTLAASVEGPKPTALSVYHPDLARNKITDVVVKSIGGLAHNDDGGATVVCKFIEYRPPKPKPAAKAGAASKAPRDPLTDPNAARKAELAALLAQAREP